MSAAPDPDLLLVFVTPLRQGSVTRAAVQAGLSQRRAMSSALDRLCTELAELFGHER
jgi:DNA-binding transcriptional LysR family regulator